MEEPRAYLVFDKTSPLLRGVVSILLIVAGFLIQRSTNNILAGLPFIVFCLILNLIRGISIKPTASPALKWQEVTKDKIAAVLAQCQRVKKFRSKSLGCFFVPAVGLLFFGIFALPFFSEAPPPFALTAAVIDALILFAGLLLSGRRSAWMPYALDVKAGIVMRILESPLVKNDPSLTAVPYLEIGRAGSGAFPNDTRILVRFKDAPEGFIGLQGQVSINTVRSSMYPYFYVVLIARPEFGLFERFKKLAFFLENVTTEKKKEGEVDVVVIRQTTTKTSGYHTDQDAQDYILSSGIKTAKRMF
jgi:hypothetical protein